MKVLKRILFIICLLILLIYVTNITAIPKEVVLFKGESLDLGNIFGVYVKEKSKKEIIQASSNINPEIMVEKSTISLNVFNMFNVKEVEVSTIPQASVIPLGNSIRIKALYNTEY